MAFSYMEEVVRYSCPSEIILRFISFQIDGIIFGDHVPFSFGEIGRHSVGEASSDVHVRLMCLKIFVVLVLLITSFISGRIQNFIVRCAVLCFPYVASCVVWSCVIRIILDLKTTTRQ